MKTLRRGLLALITGLLLVATAHAHLIVPQRGTLNIVDQGIFMVLSLPVSAFTAVDDDGDGRLSFDELRKHTKDLESQVLAGVSLVSDQGASTLEGLMFSAVPAEDAPEAPVTQIAVLGRFAMPLDNTGLKFSLRLFGTAADEQTEQIIVTRGDQTQLMTLTPDHPEGEVLPSAWQVFAEQVRFGAAHVLSGADHLLFLLVVLATGWRFRQAVFALTCFTFGHAITLIACTWFGLVVPPAIVEPAIAATIVGMAIFERWAPKEGLARTSDFRLGLVFCCALIHGLGLAGALSDIGLAPAHKALSIAGFNIGIELAQIFVTLLAAGAMRTVQALRGSTAVVLTRQLTSYAAMGLGTIWLIARISLPV